MAIEPTHVRCLRHSTEPAALSRDETRTIALLERLGLALHAYGTPAHRLEDALDGVARRLGVPGQFFVAPTAILARFERDDGIPQTFMARTVPGDVDLGRLARLDAVIGDLGRGRLDVAGATAAVDEILSAPPTYGPAITTLSFAVASGGATRFFGGGWREVLAALVIGAAIALLSVSLQRTPRTRRLFEPVAALAAALLAGAGTLLWPQLAAPLVLLGGLIVLIPGLTLTLAINELATMNLVSGTARLVGAFMTFLGIGFGVALGGRLCGILLPEPALAAPLPLPGWTMLLAMLATPLALTVLFRAQPRHASWILLSGAIAFGGARVGGVALGPELGAFLGALVVGVISHLHARTRDCPAGITLVPGIMLLVPGSFGFRSLTSLLEKDVVAGLGLAFTMVLVAVAIVTGLMLAAAIVPARRAL